MSYDAVLLLAFGGPNRFEDVRPFLANVLRGIPTSPQRLEAVVEQYRAIGGVSPIAEITIRQARALGNLLSSKAVPLKVYAGMRNWNPTIKEALLKMKEDGVRRAIGIVLAPHKSEASWERYSLCLDEARNEIGLSAPEVDLCAPWYDEPLFIEAISESVAPMLSFLPPNTQWIFTAHSIPVAMDLQSDYSGQVFQTARQVAEMCREQSWQVAYQSRSGRPQDPWLEPDVGEKILELAKKGNHSVLVVPIGFVSDNVEVLYDLDIKAKKTAQDVGIQFFRAKTVNDHPKFIAMLARLVLKKTGKSGGRLKNSQELSGRSSPQ